MTLAGLVAFAAALALGPSVIRVLRRACPERIASDSATLNTLHSAKQGTPSMGGLLVIGCWLLATICCARVTETSVLCTVGATLGLMLLGLRDDWVKAHTRQKGVTPRQKLVVQFLLGALVGAVLFRMHRDAATDHWLLDIIGFNWFPGGVGFVLWSAFLVALMSNSVNLTDGLDGLAAGTTIATLIPLILACAAAEDPISGAAGGVSMAAGNERAVVSAALLGSLLGFLWFNGHPAAVFLGDTGALPLGGLLAVVALAAGCDGILLVAGGVFLIETASVILQVAVFRMKSRRILRCSPLHNHYVFRGDPETKIVLRFWVGSAILAMLAAALVFRNH